MPALLGQAETFTSLPLRRPHFHVTGTHADQSLVVVELLTASGAVGWGEGGTPGGTPFWGGECVESIKLMIDRYLAPAITGISVFDQERVLAAMDRVAANNHSPRQRSTSPFTMPQADGRGCRADAWASSD